MENTENPFADNSGPANNAVNTSNNLVNTQITNIMEERENAFQDFTSQFIENTASNAQPESQNNVRPVADNNYMTAFDESYYTSTNFAPSDTADAYNASGQFNDQNDISNLFDEPETPKEEVKQKALELETLIVDSLARDRYDHALRQFKTLEKMHQKYKDDNVRDIYYRVLAAMPKPDKKKKTYSYKNNKNQFKDVLNAMSNTGDVRAFNEDNQCISSLGEMWEECDLNICGERCKDRIINAFQQSKNEECGKIVTGMDGDKKIRMADDVKNLILERLKYCKKVEKLQKGNFETITYTDRHDLKMKLIKEINEATRLVNLHYHSCQEKAAQRIERDPKLKQIVNIIETLDLSKMNIERLQQIRNDLNLLPNCDTIRYDEFERSRDMVVKKGLRVGDFVIPTNTEYHKQLKEQGKDNPKIYKDLVTGKNYFYDAFSKTLTGIKYPETRNLEMANNEIHETSAPAPAPAQPEQVNLNDVDIETLLGLDDLKKTPEVNIEPASSPEQVEIPSPMPSLNNNLANNQMANIVPPEHAHLNNQLLNNSLNNSELNVTEEQLNNNSLILGLDIKNILGYILILLVVLAVIYFTVEKLQKK
jgi:hypothetical protein